jgi:transketolase
VSSSSHGAADAATAPSAALEWTAADSRAVDLIRVLAMDAVQQAGSGHPGTAMSLAPAAYVLYQHIMRHDPADGTVVAWRTILEQPSRPAGLCLSRQNLPVLDRGESSQNALASADAAARGGYILAERIGSEPAVILIATGSEVQIALAARDILQGEGISTRVVSMPCVEWFTAQDASYQEEVLPPRIRARVCVEAGIAQPWHAFAGDFGECVSLEHFGASAAQTKLYEEYGFTAEHVAAAARSSLDRLDANVRSEES